ncbi:MAG: phospholipid carrier-dependent glycosyltransferase [Acidobacteria bacterium]|nr:phospholipid carrier-dependent glycosyltransferase [Acidobacteriota bacterium]
MASQQPADLAFFRVLDSLILSVVCISYASVILLAFGAFDARLAVVAGLLLAATGRYFLPASFEPEHAASGKPVFPVVLVVLLAALLFRAEPFRPMHGGQDQGVYVSMSAHLQREGSVFIDDPVPAALPDERSRNIYASGMPEDPSFAAAVQPGVYYSDREGDYVFQFYHLHPLWMAVFAELFGDGARFYALTFFGLLSIVGLCLLVLEMTGARAAALVTGLLLALNPLHVYFSRLHVTEIVALAFSAIGFYYLARAARGVQRSAPPAATATLAALSALSLSLVFFVRITGFLYLPMVVLVYGLGIWWTAQHRPAYTRQVIGYGALVAALYGVSVLYGLYYSPIYALEIYRWRFAGLLGTHWKAILAIVSLATVAAGVALPLMVRSGGAQRRLAFAARPGVWIGLASAAIALGVAGSFYEAYVIGFTERYAYTQHYLRFGVVGLGAPIFWQTGAVGWMLYTSPLLALVGIAGVHRMPRQWPLVLLYVFLAVCLFANLAVNVPVIYQHYYYARYLASEIVPYGIAIAVAVTFLSTARWFRVLGAAAIALTIPFHLYYVLQQMPVREGARPYAAMTRIADTVGDGLLLLDLDGWGGRSYGAPAARLQTPLTYYYGKRVFPFESHELDEILASFEGVSGADVWLLGNRPSTHPGLQLVRTFPYRDNRMDSAALIPTTVNENYWRQVLYLYRVPGVCETPGCDLRFSDARLYPIRRGYVYAQTVLGPGWHGLEEGHVWSSDSQTLELSKSWFDAGRWPAALRMELRPYAASPEHLVTLIVRSGEVEEEILFDGGGLAVHDVPLGCPDEAATCTVYLDVDGARSPSDVRGSADGRTLGVGLYNIGFEFDQEQP